MRGSMRRALITLLILLAAAAAVPAAAPAAASRTADGDRDKLFDDLERRVAGRGADERVSVIVTLEGRATATRTRAVADRVPGLSVGRRFSIVPAFVATVATGQLQALAARPEVSHVEANRTIRKFNNTAQASFGVTQARLDAGVAADGDRDGNPDSYSKDDLVAAVLDTGIYDEHQDLNEGKVLGFVNCTEPLPVVDPTCDNATPDDDDGHGTHVSGTLAGDGDGRSDGLYRGVAPGAALVGVKVLNAAGLGTEAELVAGIEWVVDHKDEFGIEVLNLSLGSEGCSDGTEADSQAINAAADAGLVAVVAAGNEGPANCTVGAPGSAAKALTVGSMADLGPEGPEGFFQVFDSSRGPTDDGRVKPDISAPGEQITSANGNALTRSPTGYEELSGTSMATPFVAGVALLMLDAGSSLPPDQVKARIMQTAVDWGRGGNSLTGGSRGADVDYGAGRLDAYQAIASAGAAISSPPPVPVHQLIEGNVADGEDIEYEIPVLDTSFPLAATLIIPHADESNTDLDLELRNPSGTLIDESASAPSRQEEVSTRPTGTGNYAVRVVSFDGGGDFFLDVSGGGATTSQPTGGTTTGAGTTGGQTAGGPAAAAPDTRSARLRVALSPGGSRVLRRRAIVIRFRSDEAVVARFFASISVPGQARTFRLRRVTRVFLTPNRRITVRLRVSRRIRRAISRALRRGRRVRATLRVTAQDGSLNRSTVRRRIRVRR